MPGTDSRILVIKLGALGDFVQALGPFAAIRRYHADAHITLLTTGAYADFARQSGYFDDIRVDSRPGALEIVKWMDLRRFLRGGAFGRIYDLQTSDRSSFYFRLFWPDPKPEWSGIARGCSHPHGNPGRDAMHTIERQAEQLRLAGIDDIPPPDFSWAIADTDRFGLPERFALLAPGGAAHRPAKRWPPDRFAALAQIISERGIKPVLLGGDSEREVAQAICRECPDAVSLAGQTEFADLAALARRAVVAVGNDTGPMHLTAAAGCRCLVLYSAESDPALCGQRGPDVSILRRDALSIVTPEEVAMALAIV
jgi:ADP-heptose:LPS heptosyltransferase